jgi:hypothetical protein
MKEKTKDAMSTGPISSSKSKVSMINFRRLLDNLGEDFAESKKDLSQCKSAALGAAQSEIPHLNNTDLVSTFEVFLKFTDDHQKWSFIRRERSFLRSWGGGVAYGKTSTFFAIIELFQARAIEKYKISREKHGSTGALGDAQKIQAVIEYNPRRDNPFSGAQGEYEIWQRQQQINEARRAAADAFGK